MREKKEQRRCKATSKQTGEQCKRLPIPGGTVCTSHGGRNPVVVQAAKKRLMLEQAEADAKAVLAYTSDEPLEDPIIALSKLAREVSAMKDALAKRVNALDDPSFVDGFGIERVHAEINLYNDSLDRTIRVLDILGRHDLDARRVQLAEREAQVVVWILQGFLRDLALPEGRAQEAQELMRKWVQKAITQTGG